MGFRILVVDDERHLRQAVSRLLSKAGYETADAESADDAIALHRANRYDLLVLDIALPDRSGIDLLREVRTFDTQAQAVFITAHGSIRSAVEAIQAGGYDYLTKPFDNDVLLLTIARALERVTLGRQVAQLTEDLEARTSAPGIVGRSPAIREAVRLLTKVARTEASVLLVGETGTGKELAARTIHRQSLRAAGPFVALNCGAIPVTLAESELFGHERGAFTDAKTLYKGRFEAAQGGTIFLDEVGELSAEIQVKLLRVLQEREVTRVGGSRAVPIDARVVAATNRDLQEDVRSGRFREDLYWRLKVVQIPMPPLRARREDIPLLTESLLVRVNAECRTDISGLTPAVTRLFERYHWSGNIRELSNVLRYAAIMSEASVIDVADLPPELTAPDAAADGPASPAIPASADPEHGTLDESMAAAERRLVEAALRRFEGNRNAAAAALGIDRRTLYHKMEHHGLNRESFAGRTRRR